jgi:hypothetical protein
LPDPRLFLYSYVRKEAVLSSQIEGTQSSLSDLMLYEMEGVAGVPIDDVQEVFTASPPKRPCAMPPKANCRHLGNPSILRTLRAFMSAHGLQLPEVCTRVELGADLDHESRPHFAALTLNEEPPKPVSSE